MFKRPSNTYKKKLVLEIAGVFHLHTYNLTTNENKTILICIKKVTKYLQKADHVIYLERKKKNCNPESKAEP